MDLAAAFHLQAEACEPLGSPMYAELLARLADDVEAGGPTARVLRGHEDDPGPSGLALRLAGGLHRLVLAGAAPGPTGHPPRPGGLWTTRGGPTVARPRRPRRGANRPPPRSRPPSQ